MKQRDTFLDFAKGFAISLVVLGHILEKSMEQRNGVYHFIYFICHSFSCCRAI